MGNYIRRRRFTSVWCHVTRSKQFSPDNVDSGHQQLRLTRGLNVQLLYCVRCFYSPIFFVKTDFINLIFMQEQQSDCVNLLVAHYCCSSHK